MGNIFGPYPAIGRYSLKYVCDNLHAFPQICTMVLPYCSINIETVRQGISTIAKELTDVFKSGWKRSLLQKWSVYETLLIKNCKGGRIYYKSGDFITSDVEPITKVVTFYKSCCYYKTSRRLLRGYLHFDILADCRKCRQWFTIQNAMGMK